MPVSRGDGSRFSSSIVLKCLFFLARWEGKSAVAASTTLVNGRYLL